MKYDSEAMINDLFDGFDISFTAADLGEVFAYQDGHARTITTPGGHRFLVHVQEVDE